MFQGYVASPAIKAPLVMRGRDSCESQNRRLLMDNLIHVIYMSLREDLNKAELNLFAIGLVWNTVLMNKIQIWNKSPTAL